MKKLSEVRLGVIGVGTMGSGHIANIEAGKIKGVNLVAICDIDPTKMERYGDKYKKFDDAAKLIRSGEVDAVMVETPHYFHTTIGIDALQNGIHTLVEKPISVHKADCERLIAAHTDKDVVFSAMFNQRSNPSYQKLREILQKGMLGQITRVNWIITDWFRSQAYYNSSDWRATWKGEGGGVLSNQCPHQLDLMQWLFGMPESVTAFCDFGRWHDIEVEDNVTAYLKYPNGATGVFITTTGEAPGTNRLEVCGENGKILLERGVFRWWRNEIGQGEFIRTTDKMFGAPDNWVIDLPQRGDGGQHVALLQNFVDAILHGTPLLAPAEEGIHAVELANAMIYSSALKQTVQLPLDGVAYEQLLKKYIAESKIQKTVKSVEANLADSWAK